ncbi:MAG TPA: ATP-binding cassette domain-containing protein [Candidatus Limnocylindrales bacterium]
MSRSTPAARGAGRAAGTAPGAPEAAAAPGISATDVVRIYAAETASVAALRGLDLSIEPGEIVGVLGPSGSGKSTLLRLLAGLDRPSAGSLVVGDVHLERAGDAALARYRTATVGVLDQHYWRSISPYATVADTVALPLRLRGWPAAARRARVTELLERIGLPDRADAAPSELSGGEQQRVAFAAALAPRPRLLLADEPTGELDEATARSVLALLAELVRDNAMTALIVTHDLLVETMADRLVHLHDGRVIATHDLGDGASAQAVIDRSGWTAPELPRRPTPSNPAGATDPSAVAVSLEGVSRRYRRGRTTVEPVSDLTTAFGRGGLHVVTGPSGSGKSTLLRLVTGLDRPSAGRVRTLGVDVASLDRSGLARLRATRIATMSQAPRLVPFLSALENVELGLDLRMAGAARERQARAREALERVGLADLADARPEVLSGGERARVALARALAPRPELLVLDEPTAALDRTSAIGVIDLIATLGEEVTVLAATHDRDLIAVATDRLDLRDVRKTGAPADLPLETGIGS